MTYETHACMHFTWEAMGACPMPATLITYVGSNGPELPCTIVVRVHVHDPRREGRHRHVANGHLTDISYSKAGLHARTCKTLVATRAAKVRWQLRCTHDMHPQGSSMLTMQSTII